MMSDRPPRSRWGRFHRFSLSTDGVAAEAGYRELIVASRSTTGRASFDGARAEWARTHTLQPDDGLYLAEVRGGPVSLGTIVDALETCGKTKTDAAEALGRLVDRGLVTLSGTAPADRR